MEEIRRELADARAQLVDAAKIGDLKVAELLLDLGGLLEDDGEDRVEAFHCGREALSCAAQSNDLEMAKLLLDRGVRVDDEYRCFALEVAAQNNHLEMAKLLLDRGARTGEHNSEALNCAVQSNHLEMATLLLDRGARADGVALDLAAQSNHLEMATLLLDRGASPRARAYDDLFGGSRALERAAEGNHLEMAKLLLDRGARYGDNIEALERAAQLNHLEMAKLLLDRGPRSDKHISAALARAAQNNHLEMAKLLLDRGARANESRGLNALEWAAQNNHLEMAKLLLDRGARANESRGLNALELAAEGNHLEMVKLLLDRGASAANKHSSALLLAARNNYLEMAKLLLDRGARADEDNSRALVWAAAHQEGEGNHLEMARLLLDRGARAGDVCMRECTQNHSRGLRRAPERAAEMESNHLEVAKLLVEKGAKAEGLSLRVAQKLREVGVGASLLLPCFVRHASLPDVRECIVAERLDINAEIHLGDETTRVISTFRDRIDSVIELMGEGARCENLAIRKASALQDFSRDRQNVHTSLTNKALCRNVEAACKVLEGFSTGFSLEESQTMLELETELKSENIPDSFWQQAQETNKSACSGRNLAEVKGAVIQAFDRFKRLVAITSPSPLVTSGPQALALVYRALRAALSGRPDFNLCTDVLSPIASALLQTQSEYGWDRHACGQGSVSMVLQVLEGRVDVDEAPSVAPLQAMLTSIAGWKKMLQKTSSTGEYHALVAEAQARLLEICDRAKLQEIYDCIIDGEHATYWLNKLRGLLFQALTKEFGDDLAKLRAEEEHDDTQLWGLIQDLGDVAEIFTQVCTAHMVEVVDPVSVSPRYSSTTTRTTAESVAVAH